METLSEFNFTVRYVEGTTNILADALSRIYSNDTAGTVHAAAEYTQHDEDHPPPDQQDLCLSMLLYVGLEASMIT